MPKPPTKPKPRRRFEPLTRTYSITIGHASTAVLTTRACCRRRCEVEFRLTTVGKRPGPEDMQIVRAWLAYQILSFENTALTTRRLILIPDDVSQAHDISVSFTPKPTS
jgi:hypothetical protein